MGKRKKRRPLTLMDLIRGLRSSLYNHDKAKWMGNRGYTKEDTKQFSGKRLRRKAKVALRKGEYK